MKYLLDTNTCVAFLSRRSKKVEERLRAVPPADVVLCSIVKYELLFGAHKSQKCAENLARLEFFFRPFASLPFDDEAAIHAGRVRAALEQTGTPIGSNDLLIAAIALSHDLIVITRNAREFGRVPGLRADDWEV